MKNWIKVLYPILIILLFPLGFYAQDLKEKGQDSLALNHTLEETVVSVKKKKSRYSRKNNPAVELMQKVLAQKAQYNLLNFDYEADVYQRMTFFAVEDSKNPPAISVFKQAPFLKDYAEKDKDSQTLLLPFLLEEKITKVQHQAKPQSTYTAIEAQRSEGINNFLSTGEGLNLLLNDVFPNPSLYQNTLKIFRQQLVSPLSTTSAIEFYRFFIADSLVLNGDSCVVLSFLPNNPQDFGFAGLLYIQKDGSYRVKRAELTLPKKTGLNFIKQLNLIQDFETLETGQQAVSKETLQVDLEAISLVQPFRIIRNIHRTNYQVKPLSKPLKSYSESFLSANANIRPNSYWEEHRTLPLSLAEIKLQLLLQRLKDSKSFNVFLFVVKAFIENFIETTKADQPNYFDIGPVNTFVTTNYIDGLRLRFGGQTTANLNPHWFAKAYLAYGFKDKRWKGMGEILYSFTAKNYQPKEYPKTLLTLGYQNDVKSSADMFLQTDKDNVFTSLKWTPVEQMTYFQSLYLNFEKEWKNGFNLSVKWKDEHIQPVGQLFFLPQKYDFSELQYRIKDLRTTELKLALSYFPKVSYLNSKQGRKQINGNAPLFSLSHSLGLKALGSDFAYNMTETEIHQRLDFPLWGRFDITLKAGKQWNRVPFPLLIMPATNLSFIIKPNTFFLMRNMEFLSDQYASLHMHWKLNGRVFNRVPLFSKLKWREHLGVNMLWGKLSAKNNPLLPQNATQTELYHFPVQALSATSYQRTSSYLHPNAPYVEAFVGVSNIFKVLQVYYVHRFNYLHLPNTSKWGVRFALNIEF